MYCIYIYIYIYVLHIYIIYIYICTLEICNSAERLDLYNRNEINVKYIKLKNIYLSSPQTDSFKLTFPFKVLNIRHKKSNN